MVDVLKEDVRECCVPGTYFITRALLVLSLVFIALFSLIRHENDCFKHSYNKNV